MTNLTEADDLVPGRAPAEHEGADLIIRAIWSNPAFEISTEPHGL
ncbi:hypothetical protein [Bradyrhizobium canariense]|nr:hypothetical protein [Bradyrhizobium canariense]